MRLPLFEIILFHGVIIMKRLKELREARKLNQEGLAMKLHLSQSAVSYYETGERKPDLETLIQLSEYFDVSIDYLIGRSNIKNPALQDGQSAGDINFYNDYLRLTRSQKEHVSSFVQGLLAKK